MAANAPPPTLRARAFRHLNPGAWTGRGLSPINRIVVAAILLSVVSAVLQTEPAIMANATVAQAIIGADWAFAALFSVEYLARLWVNGEDPRYAGVVGRLRYIVSARSLLDLAALVPFWLTLGVTDSFVLRLARLLRLLALARFGRFSAAARLMFEAVAARRHELYFAATVAGVVLLISATALHAVEGHAQPEAFGSIPRALWWAMATLTTVGYGDVYPITALGRFLGAITAIAAVGIIAMPAGILAAALSDAFTAHRGR